MSKKRMLGATVLAVALLTTVVLGSAWAQPMGGQTLQLTPSGGSGVTGTAVLTDTANGLQVQLSVQGLPKDGVQHLAHIHSGGTCADDRAGQGAPVEYPLESITAQGGMGSSTTVIPNVTLNQLSDGTPRYVNVHAEKTGEGTPPGISCADLAQTTTSGQVKMETTTAPLPSSGGVLPASILLPAVALLLGSGALAYGVLRRRG